MGRLRKYYKSKAEAQKEADKRNGNGIPMIKVFLMPKGTKHYGEYAVCDDLEYLNTY